VTDGTPSAQVKLFDVGIFFQDDWRARSNLTLSYGLRYEAQSQISDYADLGPRLSFAWAPAASGLKAPTTVICGGYGWFFDRFQYNNILQAVRQNGVNQKQYVVKNPNFYQHAPPAASLSGDQAAPTTYQLSPRLKAPVNMQAAIGVEHQFGKLATVSVTYINSRGIHQLYSDNINAFLPGTYNADSGTRPNGVNENLYQYQSGGVYNQNQIITNFSVRECEG
jgi:hypothetical protein